MSNRQSPHDRGGRNNKRIISKRIQPKRSDRQRPIHHHHYQSQASTTTLDSATSNIGGSINATSNLTTSGSVSNISKPGTSKTTTSTIGTLNDDYKLLLNPMFSAMTKITDNLFLTGVGGMTRENFRKNHIDFVVNITTEAPFWEDVESMRLPLEDDPATNILPYLDMAVDRIHESIVNRNAHVLVHCVAGVSRSATVVIAYLMKYKRMDLRTAFNYCCTLRPVIRPNNGFMVQLINYELQIFGRTSVRMVDADVDGTVISVPHFFIEEHPRLVLLEVMRVRDQTKSGPTSSTVTKAPIEDG